MYYRYKETDINVINQTDETVRLLQSDMKYPLSKFYIDGAKVKAIINCSYFINDYVLGRNQGDLFNNTHDQDGFYDLVFTKDGKYHLGSFKSWDYTENVLAGFSVATVLIKDGQDIELISSAICDHSKIDNRDPQTAIAITKQGSVILIVADGRSTRNKGLTGYELRDFVKFLDDIELLCQLDGGGSSEMLIDGQIVNKPSDGAERAMFNGLALITENTPKKDIEIEFPCADGWISQDFHSGHMALDIGWLTKCSSNGKTPVYACADGVVEVADFYEEVVSGKKVKPIVCILRHDDLDPDYTYYSAYWHLSSTPKNTGDVVKVGDEIGIRGNTGYSGGVHLHFVLMKCPKGTECPTSYEFNDYAIDPKPYIYLTKDEVFDGKGEYDFPVKDVEVDIPENTEEVESLKAQIVQLEADLKTAQEEKAKIEQEYSDYKNTSTQALNTAKNKLKAVNDYANEIVTLSKE